MAQKKIELAISADSELVHEHEVVWLNDGHRKTVVGDHYGDPIAGLIDRSHGWCASFGEGMIVYWLQQPFEEYLRDKKSHQWVEWGRGNYTKFIESAQQSGPFEVEVTVIEDGAEARHLLKFSKAEGIVIES